MLTFFRFIVFSLIVIINGFLALCVVEGALRIIFPEEPYIIIYSFVLTVIIIAGLIYLAFSELGENYQRNKLRVRTPYPHEKERIQPLFSEVCLKAGENPDNYDIFISPENVYNAFAFGKRTIAICYPMLSVTDEELKGILAHELSHLKHNDTRILLAANIMNTLGNIAFGVLLVMTIIVGNIFSVINIGSTESENIFFQSVAKLTTFITLIWLKFLAWLLYKILEISFMAVSRGEEYRCDEFAVKLGYGHGLLAFFQRINGKTKNSILKRRGFAETLLASHPSTRKRIEKLEKLLNLQEGTKQWN